MVPVTAAATPATAITQFVEEEAEPCRPHRAALDELTAAFLQQAPEQAAAGFTPGDHTGVAADLVLMKKRVLVSKEEADAVKSTCSVKANALSEAAMATHTKTRTALLLDANGKYSSAVDTVNAAYTGRMSAAGITEANATRDFDGVTEVLEGLQEKLLEGAIRVSK